MELAAGKREYLQAFLGVGIVKPLKCFVEGGRARSGTTQVDDKDGFGALDYVSHVKARVGALTDVLRAVGDRSKVEAPELGPRCAVGSFGNAWTRGSNVELRGSTCTIAKVMSHIF